MRRLLRPICWIRHHRWRLSGAREDGEAIYRCRRCKKRQVGRMIFAMKMVAAEFDLAARRLAEFCNTWQRAKTS